MCESRAVRGGQVYRQLFEAQVQLSRSLLAGRKDTRTECLSAEDSNTHCSTTSRSLCPLSIRGQQVDDDDDDDDVVDDVIRLPDSVVVDGPSSDIIERLTEKKSNKHKEAVNELQTELTHLSQVCEAQVRTVSLELRASLQDTDLRLNLLKDRMEQLEAVSVQEVCVLWEQVEQQVELKKIRILELKDKLRESETQRSDRIRAVLRKYFHLLEKISFLSPPDVCRLIHTEATMLNQSLLANRRSAARLVLLLQEDNLQQEAQLRLHWDDCLNRWRRTRVTEVIDRFRSLCSRDDEQQPVSGQLVPGQLVPGQPVSGQPVSGQLVPGQLVPGQLVPGQLVSGQLVSGQLVSGQLEMKRDLTERRDDLIYKICSLVPPSCSTALVSDWFSQLMAVNQRIDSLHADLLHQLRCCYERSWQDGLAQVQRCEEALSALQLPEEEVNDIISSQLLTLIGQRQSQDEERLAALDRCCDSLARGAVSLSRCVFVVMRGVASLWETHSCSLVRREEELQRQLDDLRRSQQHIIQRKKVHLDELLGGLRQESSEGALKTSLDKTVLYLQDLKLSCRQCVSEQWELLDRLPSLFLEELLSYSRSLSAFYHLRPSYRPSPEELQNLLPSSSSTGPTGSTGPTEPETSEAAEEQKPEENHPISCQNDAEPHPLSQDWLTEAESSLLHLYDISSDVTFTSSRGVTYSGPAFRCPAPDLQQETHLSPFPVELLTHTLSRVRTLFLDHLEQRFHDVLRSAVVTVTDRKEAVRSEQELQLQQLNPRHINTHIYQLRLAELLLHRQQVDVHCEEVSDVLSCCRAQLQELQTSVSRKNQEFSVSLSNMEDDVLTADSSQRLQALSSTLQDRLDQHIKHTQNCQSSFRDTVHSRLEEVRGTTTQLLHGFRLFSEGGDFAPQELKLFQRRLKEEAKQIRVTEESIYSELELFESRSLQQVKEASAPLEEKLSFLKSELEFTEKIQKIISSTRVHIRAEAASSNQQQSSISSRVEDLRRMMENTQVCPDQVFSLLSSVSEELRRRRQYLDFSLDPPLQESLSARLKSRKQVHSAPPDGLLQSSRTGVEFQDDPVVGVIKSLNRFCRIQDVGAEREDAGTTAAGQSPVQQPQHTSTQSVSALSVRRGCRSTRTDRRLQLFGSEPEQTHSFSSTVNSLLWKSNDVLLPVAEEFYRSERCGLSRFFLVPDSLDQWTASMQQRLLGYQEESRKFLSTSREEFVSQLSEWAELLYSLPAVLISNHEQQQGAGLLEEVGGIRLKLEKTLSDSEDKKRVNVCQLRASLSVVDLQTVSSREEERQQQLHGAVCSTHLELQECVRVRGEEFVTSLASLTERLLRHLLTPEETEAELSHQLSEVSTVTMETGAESRTWSGVTYLSPPTNSTAEPLRTASITTTRCTLGHLAVIQQRDAAVKRFQQLFLSELTRSEDDKRRQLSELQSWSTHWRQETHTLTHTHTGDK